MKNHTPLRMCIACRQMKPKQELIRFVNADNKVVIDTDMKIQSRGAYMCCTDECFRLLKKKHGLERNFKSNVQEAYSELQNMFSGD